MGWFDNWYPKPPEEFRFFSPSEYAHFAKLVTRYVQRKYKKFEIQTDRVILSEAPRNKQHVFLGNLARICHQLPRKTWGDVIAAHFRGIAKNHQEMTQLDARINNFSFVEPLLSVRVCAPDSMTDQFVHRVDLDGTVSVLVFDLPETIRYVHPETIKGWGKSIDELFQVGLDNLRISCMPEPKIIELEGNRQINILSGESFFVSSHALLMDEHPKLIGSYGIIFSVPIRHAVLSIPMNGPDVLSILPYLAKMTIGMAEDGPGSISTRLYWQHEGNVKTIECTVSEKEKSLTIRPPEELVSLLETLGGNFEFGGFLPEPDQD